MEYYNRMRNIREDNDMTQKEIASLMSIKQQQYSEYESGKRLIPITYLKQFCEILNVSADYILGLPQGMNYFEL
ncbi:MAG: helix-turn-helix domain-containing protein [Eubacterium sp.]